MKDYNLCSEGSTLDAKSLVKMNDEEHVFHPLRRIPRNDDWQFFLQLMMDKNATATLTPSEIVFKLVEKKATIKHETGLGQETLLFAKGNAQGNGKGKCKGKGKRRKSWKRDKSDEDQGDRKSQTTCVNCHQEGHQVWNCPSMTRGDLPVSQENTVLPAKDDCNTAARVLAEMTRIESYWVTDTGGKLAPSKESGYLDCASTSHMCGDRRRFAWYTGFTRIDEREIRDFAGKVAGKAIGQGDVQLRLRLPGSCTHGGHHINELVVRDVLHVAGAHTSLSQSMLMDRGLRIVAVNGYGTKIYDKAPAMGTGRGGQGSLVAVAPQVGGLFRFDVDVKVAR